ncbi:hypothetical protein ABTX85_08285 [Streptomyces sp. NPDC096097]
MTSLNRPGGVTDRSGAPTYFTSELDRSRTSALDTLGDRHGCSPTTL